MSPMATPDPTSFIAAALAPAVVLSACAVLSSNAQTNYSDLVDRLRLLNAERRDYQEREPLTSSDALRIKSLDRQIALIFRRLRHLRDALFLLAAGMASLIATSFVIAAIKYFGLRGWVAVLPKWAFLAGLFLVLAGLIHKILEVRLTFRVVEYELGLFDEAAAREAERQFRAV